MILKIYITIKIYIKSLISNCFINFSSLLFLPIAMVGIMGLVGSSMFNGSNNIEKTDVFIVDNDRSSYSSNLIDFVKGDLKSIASIVDNKDDASIEISIPKGYSKQIKSNSSGTIYLENIGRKVNNISTISKLIDKYHEKLYISNIYGTYSNIFKQMYFNNSIESNYIDNVGSQSSYQFHTITCLGLMVIMAIISNYNSNNSDLYVGLQKRITSQPLSKFELIAYDSLAIFIQSFIFTVLYVFFFRAIKVNFMGNIFILLLISAVTSLFVTSISIFLISIFPKKIGTLVVYILLSLQFLFGGIAYGLSNFLDSFSMLSPTKLISDMFTNYNTTGNFSSFSSSFLICIAISLILLVVSIVKEKYFRREI